jgi:hypothetical protein
MMRMENAERLDKSRCILIIFLLGYFSFVEYCIGILSLRQRRHTVSPYLNTGPDRIITIG